MAINKVVLNNETVLDLTNDTVSADKLAQGYTAHDKTGNAITGTMIGGSGFWDEDYAKQFIERTASTIVFPSGLTKIGEHAFQNCYKLVVTTLPSSITSIEDYAFTNCFCLALTNLPDGITNIGQNAFNGCTNLKTISLPQSLDNLGYFSFANCYNLTSVTFNSVPTTINTRAFYASNNLTDIYVPWAEGAVANAPWGATNATIHYNSTT